MADNIISHKKIWTKRIPFFLYVIYVAVTPPMLTLKIIALRHDTYVSLITRTIHITNVV